jgi:energy-coupling factor transporter ATP-binding protein EcfA2
MIKNISIKNFKCIQEQNFSNLPNIVGIWGENGTGKSSLLQAIIWATRLNGGLSGYGLNFHSIENIIYGRDEDNSCIVEIGNDFGHNVSCSIIEKRTRCEGIDFDEVRYFPTWRYISSRGSLLENMFESDLGSRSAESHSFLHWLLHDLNGKIMRGDSDSKETFERLNYWSEKIGFGKLLDSRTSNKEVMGTYYDSKLGLEVPLIDGGFGGNSFLPIILECYSFNNGIILIEEPEISLHPGAQGDIWDFIMEMVEKRNHQIIFTSHSPYLATKMGRSLRDGEIKDKIHIYLTNKTEKGTIFNYISEEEMEERFVKYWEYIFPELKAR